MQTASFRIQDVSDERRKSGNAWLEFLDVDTLSMGLYFVPAGTDDRETHEAHERDEVYIGVAGKGRLIAGGEEYDVEPGVVVYVKAGVEHHFHDVIEDLNNIVFFSGSKDEASAQ